MPRPLPGALALFTLLLAAGCGSPEPIPRRPVVVVGVDGATWDVIDPMMARGELPNFQKLVGRGARSDLIVLPTLRSPVIWTTYATGHFGRTHNILDFTYPYVSGVPKQVISSNQRRVPALWNVASAEGRTVGLVGYYATDPAEVVKGFVVSDVAVQGKGGTTYPSSLHSELDLASDPDRTRESYAHFLPWKYDPKDADDLSSPYQRASLIVRDRIHRAIITDENVRRVALQLQPRAGDLFMTYFRIVDQASHAAWIYYDDTDFEALMRLIEEKETAGLPPNVMPALVFEGAQKVQDCFSFQVIEQQALKDFFRIYRTE
jgi:predicted AlkP superfamily phosphohydrolase/phosphomutase